MPDTTTPVLGLVKQTIGGNRNTWGAIINSCMDLIEGAFYGMTSMVVTGAGDVTLTDAQRRKRILKFSGTLGANQTIIVANLVGRWVIYNGTTGNYTLSFKTVEGAPVVIPQGGHCDVWCDGADGMYAGLSTRLRDTQMLAPNGTLAAPGLSWASEIASGVYRISAGVFAWVIAGVARIRLEAAVFKVVLGSAVEVISSTDTAMTIGVPLEVPALTVSGESPVPIGGSIPYDGIFEPNGWKFKNGQALSRTTYALLFAALTATATATRNGTTTLSGVSVDLTGLGLEGAPIEGTGIPSSTTISSLTATTITLSQAATGSGSMTIRVLPHGVGDGSTTFNVPDDRGRVDVARDNMGGISANHLTGQTGGIDGDKLGLTGGEESHALTSAENAQHSHSAAVDEHGGHYHQLFAASGGGGPLTNLVQALHSFFWGSTFDYTVEGTATTATIGKSEVKETGITVAIGNSGSGTAHNNVQPSRVTNKIIFTGVYV